MPTAKQDLPSPTAQTDSPSMLNSQLNAPLTMNADKGSKNKFPSSFFGCAAYTDKEGKSMCFPAFCPQAMLCTNSIVGRVCSKVIHEEPSVCCEMGPMGVCMCVALIPLGIYTPSGGLGIYCCLTNYLRSRAMQEHNIEEEAVCVSGPDAPGPINFCFHGIFYPCSIFQVYIALKELADNPNKPH